MTRLDDVASKDITADQITGEDAPAPAPVQGVGDCWDPRTEDALKGKFPKCWEWEGDGRGIACIYPWYAGCLADCESQSPSDSECAADCKKYEGCKKYNCLSPENCASLGGENHGKHNHDHSGALAWSTGVAAVTVAASTVAFL